VLGGPLGGRFPAFKKAMTPGPADYCVQSIKTLKGIRMVRPGPPRDPKAQGPAPNAYILPDTLDHRNRQLGCRLPHIEKCPTPGPGQYDIPDADLYMPGRFKMGRSMGRRIANKGITCTPGPADYDGHVRPNCCRRAKNGVCRITFGIRRPDTVPAFAVPADNQYNC